MVDSKPLILLLVMSTMLMMSACTPSGQTYGKKHCIDDAAWAYDEALVFDDYRIKENEESIIRIYHGATYGYENLYIQAIIETADSDTISNHVYSIPLMNQYGEWLGQSSGAMTHTDYSFDPRIPKASLTDTQNFRLLITQYSREERLRGVTCIEIITKKQGSI